MAAKTGLAGAVSGGAEDSQTLGLPQYGCRWAGGEHMHAQRGLSQKVSELPAGTGSLWEAWGAHGWDGPMGKDLSGHRLGSVPISKGLYGLCLLLKKQTAKPACMKPDYSNLLTSRIMQ